MNVSSDNEVLAVFWVTFEIGGNPTTVGICLLRPLERNLRGGN